MKHSAYGILCKFDVFWSASVPAGWGGTTPVVREGLEEVRTSLLDLTNEEHAHIDQRLRKDIIIWLSSVRPDGRPHIVAVWFLWDGQHIYIFSQPNTQKIRNLRHNSHVMLGLDETRQGSDVVLIEGTAELLNDPAINATMPAYAAKYAANLAHLGWTAEQMSKSYSQAIRITPTRFHFVS